MVKKQIEFDEEKINWFYQKFGTNASLTWLCDLLFAQFIEAMEKSPEDYARIGALALKEKLEDGVQ